MADLLSQSGISNGDGKTFPDMLKNTPSNIRKLANEIQQHEGRKKYLSQTKSPSDGGDVRWYFCKIPLAANELAAAVPRTEVVGKGDYFRFGMRDSLAIEASFLQGEEELLSSWWKEYAECSEGPKDRPSSSGLKGSPLEAVKSAQLYGEEEERVGVPVKGGLYEVDLGKRHCFPVYWSGENRRVLRGHWFARKGGLDWLPVREGVAEQLEFAYCSKVWRRRTFQPSGLFAARIDLLGSTPGCYVLFTGEDDTWEAWLNYESSGFSNVISLGGNGIMLRRGYSASQSRKPTQDELRQQKEEEMDDYCSQVPVGHLIFMVHGIGQRLEKSNLVDDVTTFRHITASLAERHLTPCQLGTQRVLFIPCQWRKGLKLSGEAAVEKITLQGVRGLRTTLSATVHDVLYYMSPIYCQDIINSVSNQLNRLYLKFLKRNPGYDGKVSLYGHSLGSVLSYDILCHQENLSSPFPMEFMFKEQHELEKNSHCMIDGQSSECSRVLSQEKNASVNQTEGISIPGKEENAIGHSLVLDGEEVEDEVSNAGNFFVAPDSEEPDGCSPVEKEKDAQEYISNCESILSLERHDLNEASSMNFDASVANSEIVDESDKDREIQLLRAEIDSLKLRISELKPQDNGKGNELLATVANQLITGKPPAENAAPASYTPYIKYTKLEFKVDTFFAVGSPLGVFLALRNIRIGIGKGKDYWEEENINEEMPACRQMFNIFHPFDPVAYRIEPLICKEYISKRPVIIPYHKGGKRLHIGFQEFGEDLALRSQVVMNQLYAVRVKVLTICQSKAKDGLDDDKEDTQRKEERSYGSVMMEKLTGSEDSRIDHVLQDKTFQHPYVEALGAHTNYWRDNDTALFILKHLYRDVPEDSALDESKNNSGAKKATWPDRGEAVDEELPLTFGDSISVRNFSLKAKKIMKR